MSYLANIGERLPFIRRLIDEGVLPPDVKSFTLTFKVDDVIRVTYDRYAPEEMLTEEVAGEIAAEVAKHGAVVVETRTKEPQDAPSQCDGA